MADLLGIGSSALLAYRSALNVVGQNVANANTTGYSRQRVDLQSNYDGQVATGVSVRTITRLSDPLVFNRLVAQDSGYARSSAFQSQAALTDGWLSGASTGLSTPLQGFFSALSSLSASASSTATRQVVMQGAQTLASRFNDLQANFNDTSADVDARLADSAQQVSSLAGQIAKLNQRISEAATFTPGQTPNELLDQRDQLVRQVAEQVGIQTSESADGALNISLGTGQALVLGNRAATLSVGNDDYGRARNLLLTSQPGATPVSVTGQVAGGTIGGLLDFRREVLEPGMGALGRMAATLASAVNAQHAEGMDQYGEMGGAFFAMPTGTALAAMANTGSATVSMTLTDPGRLATGNYELSYDGSAWSLADAATGAAVALSGSGSADDPLVGAGLSLTLGGTAAAGDRFLLQPAQTAAGQIKPAITDPARIAASNPLRTTVATGNTGVATIAAPEILDAGNPSLLDGVTIAFTSATTFTINGAGSYSYASGQDIDYNGWRVQIGGTPATGDRFSLGRNDGSSGDNSNAVVLAGLVDQGLVGSSGMTISAANSALVSTVGGQAAQAGVQLEAQQTLSSQLQAERDSMSGVNLDEEAADLMRYQQAYQAAAQIVSTANTLFDSLLAAIRR